MVDNDGKNDEEKLDFDSAGEAPGYLSLDQAQVLAMRTASESPGAYGSRFRGTPMAFEAALAEESEDHYVITLSFRPQGEFAGTPPGEPRCVRLGAVGRGYVGDRSDVVTACLNLAKWEAGEATVAWR
ncbi:MAG: hypothetical protein QF467_07805, partial [SAR202 cluster bacterium]|nr:hypothetical protein [SAR202 cluster bacterium]